MKTFKVAAFFIEKNGELIPITLQDGLVINREDEQRSWLIELFLNEEDVQAVRAFEQDKQLTVRIAISHRGNDPAMFNAAIRSFQPLELGTSVLFDAQLRQIRNEYAKQVLHSLIEQGLEGEKLIEVFSEAIRKRPNTPDKEKNVFR
ncbi:YwpF-like family protein [Domibacillus sp. A3M-37]|uniref:YwpF-like family protein n=1 Tax=Domibacillus sp. A3M-37 TaxID=2962037 RepID=UPI0020B88E77|nr:YwpF-like family protein [Domibacillus sp. A3M-37]MCP3761453.1 YwpF-like family protein [Domibacillus sp. A3M-37]